GGGFVEAQMTVQAEAKHAEIDRAILLQPTGDTRAFGGRISGLAFKRGVARFEVEWVDEQIAQIGFAGGGAGSWNATPLVEFENSKLREQMSRARREKFVGARWGRAGCEAQKQRWFLGDAFGDEVRRGGAHCLVMWSDVDGM